MLGRSRRNERLGADGARTGGVQKTEMAVRSSREEEPERITNSAGNSQAGSAAEIGRAHV